MKTITLFIFSCCFFLNFSNTAYSQGNPNIHPGRDGSPEFPEFPLILNDSFYYYLKDLIVPIVPTEQELIDAHKHPSTTLPENFIDTLRAYDWYKLSNYFFKGESYRSDFANLDEREIKFRSTQLNFLHHGDNGLEYDFAIMRDNWEKKLSIPQQYINNANQYGATKIIKKGKTHYIVYTQPSTGYTDEIEIISYRDGVLILCTRATPNATKSKFHNAYYRVKKIF